jgi:hypothetical protein
LVVQVQAENQKPQTQEQARDFQINLLWRAGSVRQIHFQEEMVLRKCLELERQIRLLELSRIVLKEQGLELRILQMLGSELYTGQPNLG